jgi:hypothetical protein
MAVLVASMGEIDPLFALRGSRYLDLQAFRLAAAWLAASSSASSRSCLVACMNSAQVA